MQTARLLTSQLNPAAGKQLESGAAPGETVKTPTEKHKGIENRITSGIYSFENDMKGDSWQTDSKAKPVQETEAVSQQVCGKE